MYVPVVFWGVWVGAPGQPWTWICEEEINPNRNRRMALSTDGTFYATDVRGLTVSTDKGCTWRAIAGSEPAPLRLSAVETDATDGTTAWVVSGDSGGVDGDGAVVTAQNGLFVTHDHGATFARTGALDPTRLYHSVKQAPSDAKTIYVTSTAEAPPFLPTVHVSQDGGMTFQNVMLANTVDGVVPYVLEVTAIDPRDATVVYVRAIAAIATDAGSVGRQVLLRSIDGGKTFAEIARLDGIVTPSGASRGIDGVAIDAQRGKLLVATATGLYAADDAGRAPTVTLAPTGGLTQAQCIDVHGGALYACSSNFAPDNQAIGRSDDGAQSFQKVLEFVDTAGPVQCPAGTPVGDQCPLYWQMYGSQLGIMFPDGSDAGTPPPTAKGCHCSFGAGASALPAGLVAILCLLLLRRRRAR
jgi:hypothetical protein